MKKFLFAALFCLFSLSELLAFYPRNIVSIRGGVNISSMAHRSNGKPVSLDIRKPKAGWHVGVVDEILLMDDMPLYLDLGVMLSNKGVRYVSESWLEGTSYAVSSESVSQYGIGYLQFPVCVRYHFYFGDFTLQPYAGLHYDVGLWGRHVVSSKVQCKQNSELNSKSKDVVSLFEHDTFRRSDFGLMLGVGVTYQERYYLGVSWDDGLCNISKTKDVKVFNYSNVRVSLGYNF